MGHWIHPWTGASGPEPEQVVNRDQTGHLQQIAAPGRVRVQAQAQVQGPQLAQAREPDGAYLAE